MQCNDLIFVQIVNFIFYIKNFESTLYQLLGVISNIQTVFLHLTVPNFVMCVTSSEQKYNVLSKSLKYTCFLKSLKLRVILLSGDILQCLETFLIGISVTGLLLTSGV